MRFVNILAHGMLIALIGFPASARCVEDLFAVESWSAYRHDQVPELIYANVVVTYRGKAPIRMVNATARFDDVLGRNMGGFVLPADLSVQPGETFTLPDTPIAQRDYRILKVAADDIVATVCTTGLVYADGAIEQFD